MPIKILALFDLLWMDSQILLSGQRVESRLPRFNALCHECFWLPPFLVKEIHQPIDARVELPNCVLNTA